jgi:hypothetical protein
MEASRREELKNLAQMSVGSEISVLDWAEIKMAGGQYMERKNRLQLPSKFL